MNILDSLAPPIVTRGHTKARSLNTLGAVFVLSASAFACGDSGGNKTDTTAGNDAADAVDGDTTPADVVEDTQVADAADTDVGEDTETTADIAETSDTSDAAMDTDSDTSVVVPTAVFSIVDKGTPVDITPDGTAAIFWDYLSTDGDTYVWDVAAKTLIFETTTGPTFRDFPTAVSSNLEITALYSEPVAAGLWTQTKEWRRLGSLFAEGCGIDPNDEELGEIGGAWDISADGSVVVGLIWDGCVAKAFRWSEVEGTRDFRTLEEVGAVREGLTRSPNSRATVVSDDGKVAAGWVETAIVDRWPTLWNTEDGTGTKLTTTAFTDDSPGEILAISADGKSACGVWNQNGFVWTEAGGVVATGALENVLPNEPTFANAITADGALVFGASGGGFFGTPQAFVWSADKGMRRLVDIANAAGANIADTLILGNVLGASSDGTVLIGTLLDADFNQKAFVLELPASAYAD
jgi:hypothetical protein